MKTKQVVSFSAMEDGTKEDFVLIYAMADKSVQDIPDRMLRSLEPLKTSFDGYKINRYQHSLQTATRAYRSGEDDYLVMGALFHDIGDLLSPYNHGEMAAAILKPYVGSAVGWWRDFLTV